MKYSTTHLFDERKTVLKRVTDEIKPQTRANQILGLMLAKECNEPRRHGTRAFMLKHSLHRRAAVHVLALGLVVLLQGDTQKPPTAFDGCPGPRRDALRSQPLCCVVLSARDKRTSVHFSPLGPDATHNMASPRRASRKHCNVNRSKSSFISTPMLRATDMA